ncbi:hypothetical protein C0J52_26564 [Blattella germanica]|nr:hypothetical protein C0J52_26564 [Blattella germanica]
MIMDNEQPHQELVKCVVVGDTAVGKTRLICARACNKHVSLSQLLTTHVPTVWAIDQYRIYKDVLERSWEVVDGVNVSLRLWDTFGDHEKDRRFAYGRSDVVLLCFSITNPVSLRNCKVMWYPEIRRFCPQTPVLLVGCKNDLRYMYRDETYLSFFRDRSPFVRPTRKSDLVMPDQARAIAKELGVYYYETSVLTYYGVNEVFENAIRAALIARRQQRFWMTNLKKVQRPLLQAPFRPPKPPTPELHITASSYAENMQALWLQQAYTDVILVAGNVGFSAHRFVLSAASPAFHRLLMMDLSSELGARSSTFLKQISLQQKLDVIRDIDNGLKQIDAMKKQGFSQSTVAYIFYIFKKETHHFKSYMGHSMSNRTVEKGQFFKYLYSVSTFGEATMGDFNDDTEYLIRQSDNYFKPSRVWEQLKRRSSCQVLSTDTKQRLGVSRELNHPAFQAIRIEQLIVQSFHIFHTFDFLNHMRRKSITDVYCKCVQEIRQAAEFLDLPELLVFVSNIQAHEEFLNTDLKQHYRKILFPGVREDTFHKLLVYLYTDDVPPISPARCLDLLELGNRLCLPRLVNLVERRVVEEMVHLCSSDGADVVVEHCLRLLEPCKLHNADQLADWCMSHLCTNYNKLCKMSPKLLRSLHPENQDYLSEHRWPPVYLKDFDYYQKCATEREREEKPSLKRGRNNSGCLCFTGGKSRREERGTLLGGSGNAVGSSVPGSGSDPREDDGGDGSVTV